MVATDKKLEQVLCLTKEKRSPGGCFITNALCIGYERPSRAAAIRSPGARRRKRNRSSSPLTLPFI